MSGLGCFANESGNGCQAVIQNMKDRTPRFLCLSPLWVRSCVALMIVKPLHWTTEKQWGGGAGGRGPAGTDGRANPLFLKLGEFFPWTVIRILMMLTVTAGGSSSSFSGATLLTPRPRETEKLGQIENMFCYYYKTILALKSAMLLPMGCDCIFMCRIIPIVSVSSVVLHRLSSPVPPATQYARWRRKTSKWKWKPVRHKRWWLSTRKIAFYMLRISFNWPYYCAEACYVQ